MNAAHPAVRISQAMGLLVVCLLLYNNTFDHPYHLDSTYGLRDNPSIRNLANIPSYFTDPYMLTSLRQNVDYRPVLLITYALNYAWSQGDVWSWHLVQILLHAWVGFSLMLLARFLLPRMVPNASESMQQVIPYAVAVLFVIHPTASGVVNYLWARSSLLTAAFVLPAILLYLRSRTLWAALLYTLALFTKIEAVSVLGVFLLWEVVGVARARMADRPDARPSFVMDILGALNQRTLLRLAPCLVVTLAYAVIRHQLIPDFAAEARSDDDVTSWHYFITQTTVWWYYIFHWIAPVDLVADNLGYPIYRSVTHPHVLLALSGWACVASGLTFLYRTGPIYTFLVVSSLALISPTSSVLPLAEMVNEHRPYLPMGVLSLCWVIPGIALAVRQWERSARGRPVAAISLLLVLVSVCSLTRQRNQVYKTWHAYWEDVVAKAPSWRSHLNLGYALMGQGKLDEAERYFKRSLDMAPNNLYVLTNLGVLSRRQKRYGQAFAYFDRAVAVDKYGSIALESRSALHLVRKQYQQALVDLMAGAKTWRDVYALHRDTARAYAGLRQWKQSLAHTLRCRDINAERTGVEIVEIAGPYWDSRGHMLAGVEYFKGLVEVWPGQWWAHSNLAQLASLMGNLDLATQHDTLARSLKQTPDGGSAKSTP